MNFSSPSFIEMELTIALPCTHLSPASITSHFEESTITGTREMSGSEAISLRKRSIAATPSIMPSSMLTSMTCAPASTCCAATVEAGVVVAVLDQLAEAGGAGDVGALADVEEEALLGDGDRLEAGQTHRRTRSRAAMRGATPLAASAIAPMCSAVVPQQPPTMLTSPLVANSPSTSAIWPGVWSYSPNALGRPALGCAETKQSATRESSATYGRSSSAPRAQLRPTASGRTWRTEFQNASVTWPDRVRPLASVMVPDTITGQRRPCSSKSVSRAKIAALALRVSKIVSISRMSAPPSTRPRASSR